ncbi:MAG: photosynthesis system II assembly factor Ycf48 [Cyanobacteria bacterium J083]|nr:MAG: photosynthesis system II assembly factor Ycf48 [Cyanobacteria bacterium J083]
MKIFGKLKQFVILIAISVFCFSCSSIVSTSYNPWREIDLPTEALFADVDFVDSEPNHGWLVGTKATIFETKDGGNTWEERILDLGDEKVNFNAVSFYGEEGWIVGEPSILLHTKDGGNSWSRIPLSEKLPGAPYGIVALDQNSAEMVTDLGAIYRTNDGGKTWQALVEGAVGVARNISRSADGKYVAVSAKGNFYSTWQPGDTEWTPHQRTSSRRLQNMGFTPEGHLWLIARGGQIQFSSTDEQGEEVWGDAIYPEPSTSWGFLDVTYRTPEEIWVSGGSGNLLVTPDQGKTWQKDRDVESIPSNFYKVIFNSPEQGFVLGQRGILLKYEPQSPPA